MRKFIFTLLLAIMIHLCILPAIAADNTPSQNSIQVEALATFERFQSMWLERDSVAMPELSGNAVSSDSDSKISFFEPFDGFSIQADYSGTEEWPSYICCAESNDSFPFDTLWTIFLDCMRAVEPALAEDVARELMQELLFVTSPLSEDLPGISVGIVAYGRWRFTLTTMENDSQGPMVSISPVEEPLKEMDGTSTARVGAVYRRFRQISEWLGFELAENTPGAWDDSDPAGRQFIRPLAQDAWWHLVFVNDVFLGQGMRILPDSPLYGHDYELFISLALALDPTITENDINGMYAQLQAQTQETSDGKTGRLLFGDTQYLLSVTPEQYSLMALRQSAFDDQPKDVETSVLTAEIAYDRFRQACEEMGYTLLPEESDGDDNGSNERAPMLGLIWDSIPFDTDLYFNISASIETIPFDEAMPIFSIAMRAVDPSWTLEDARAFLEDMRANMREDGSNLVCTNDHNGVVYVLMDQGGDNATLSMLVRR